MDPWGVKGLAILAGGRWRYNSVHVVVFRENGSRYISTTYYRLMKTVIQDEKIH
jgi:hypothetical protein